MCYRVAPLHHSIFYLPTAYDNCLQHRQTSRGDTTPGVKVELTHEASISSLRGYSYLRRRSGLSKHRHSTVMVECSLNDLRLGDIVDDQTPELAGSDADEKGEHPLKSMIISSANTSETSSWIGLWCLRADGRVNSCMYSATAQPRPFVRFETDLYVDASPSIAV